MYKVYSFVSKHYRPFQITIGKVRIGPEIPSSALFATQYTRLGRCLPYPYLVTTTYCFCDAEKFDLKMSIKRFFDISFIRCDDTNFLCRQPAHFNGGFIIVKSALMILSISSRRNAM